MILRCPKCNNTYKPEKNRYICDCGSVLIVEYSSLQWRPKGEGVWRYKFALPFRGRPVTMDEGNTGMVHSESVENKLGLREVYFKLEGDNPTDSFKDRGTTVVISRAKKEGFKTVGVASTGNMGASVAAYAAHGNLKTKVFVPADTPEEKIAQIVVHGAELVRVEGTFQDCVNALWDAVHDERVYLAETGLNPYYIEGEKTLGFEIYEDVGIPDKIIVPMGTGGLITAIYKAFKELKQMKRTRKLPQMVGVQAAKCSPIIDAWKRGSEEPKTPKAETIASAIMVKTPFNGRTAIRAINESNGTAVEVTDRQIVRAMKELGKDGIFAEPASATTLAALEKIEVEEKEKVVLVITGHGLKQPEAVFG